MGTEKTASSRPSRWRLIVLLALLLVALGLTVYLRVGGYWLPQQEASQRAKEFVDKERHGLDYQSIQSWKKWDGHWMVQFDSTPPLTVNVDRHGDCTID